MCPGPKAGSYVDGLVWSHKLFKGSFPGPTADRDISLQAGQGCPLLVLALKMEGPGAREWGWPSGDNCGPSLMASRQTGPQSYYHGKRVHPQPE